MAIKYSKRKKHNSGTIRKSYNNKTGRTRVTTTVKQRNYTRSRSVNKDGSVRITQTHKSPSGFITRTTKTFGSKSKKSAPPKVKRIVTKKPKKVRFTVSGSKTGTYTSSKGTWFWIIIVIILLYWIFT